MQVSLTSLLTQLNPGLLFVLGVQKKEDWNPPHFPALSLIFEKIVILSLLSSHSYSPFSKSLGSGLSGITFLYHEIDS